MAEGEILHGGGGVPLHGAQGTVLYATPITMAVSVTVAWADGNDLDICAFYSHNQGRKVGWSYATGGEVYDLGDGFKVSWSGDNTQGGPETISLSYNGYNGLAGKRFEIHLNWYNPGEGHSGGDATVTATDAKGNTYSYTIMPAHTKNKAAGAGNPGVAIVFNRDGTIRGIEAA